MCLKTDAFPGKHRFSDTSVVNVFYTVIEINHHLSFMPGIFAYICP